ncbi:hypothetical protein NPX13_g6757 [Xylaria arbuscula]|uniref:Uncharacterized protein n=1 Tax=Xylaria arbuscula TaxID=114810 RepID=A0A9W8NBV3_9PEZI|nr:hypothetical protein NPX13_g6757 [Xylaria arbuscula]
MSPSSHKQNEHLYKVRFRHENCKAPFDYGNETKCEFGTLLYGRDIFKGLPAVASQRVVQQCGQDHKPIRPVSKLSASIVWVERPPPDSYGGTTKTAVTEGSLETMRQRNCGDYILVEFSSDYGDGLKRRKSVLDFWKSR